MAKTKTNQIPDGWEETTLSIVGKVITGKTPSKNNPEHWGTELDFITPSDINSDAKYILSVPRRLSDEGIPAYKRLLIPRKSVIVTCIGSDMGKVVLNANECLTNQQINSLIVNEAFNTDYVYYKLKGAYNVLRMYAEGGGSTMPIINKSTFERLPFQYPPLPEQKAIAGVLSSLDDKIELLRKQNETLEAIAQTIFKEWFVNFNFPCLLIYDERTQADHQELMIYGYKDFGGLPAPQSGKYYTYVLELDNGHHYIGQTRFLLKRYHEHVCGDGANYTKGHKPTKIVHWEEHDSREDAVKREKWLKSGFGRKWLKREKDANRLRQAGGKMIDSELGEIPEGWRVGKLDDEFDIVMGQSPPGSSYNQTKEGAVFFQGRTDFGERFPKTRLYTTDPKRMAEAFDVLVSVRAPVGDINVAAEKCCIGRGLGAVRGKHRSYTLYKMKHLGDILRGFEAEGTVFGSIGKDDFKNIDVIVPLPEFVESFDNTIAPIDDKMFNNHNQIQTLTRLRDTLLPKLMSGKVRVKL